LDLVVRKNLVDAVLLGGGGLITKQKDRLVRAVAAHLRRASRAVALDDEQLGRFGILDRAVCELPRKRHALERRLAPRELARLACGLACALCGDRLVDDLPRIGGVLLQVLRELLVDRRRNDPAYPR